MDEQSVDTKAEKLHNMVLDKLDEFCPEKTRRISDDDKPWFSEQLKRLARKKARLFRKSTSSKKYKRIQAIYKEKKSEAKKNFKKNMIDDVITARSGQWYSKMKRITNFGREKSETIQVDEISHLPDQDQAESIVDSFSAISNE